MDNPNNPNSFKEKSSEILVSLCEGYKIVLPKLMGCVFCQFVHELFSSDTFKHCQTRKEQLQNLQTIVDNENFDPQEALTCLDAMGPFQGRFGNNFYKQCNMILLKLIYRNER